MADCKEIDILLEVNILQGHTAPIMYLVMSSDREFIASYSVDKQIRIWGVI